MLSGGQPVSGWVGGQRQENCLNIGDANKSRDEAQLVFAQAEHKKTAQDLGIHSPLYPVPTPQVPHPVQAPEECELR